MATRTAGGMIRMDINDPRDVQFLVNSGLAWRSGPKTLQTIFRFIADGEVTRNPEKEPPEVAAYLDKVSPVQEPESELFNPLDDEDEQLAIEQAELEDGFPVEPTVEAQAEPPLA